MLSSSLAQYVLCDAAGYNLRHSEPPHPLLPSWGLRTVVGHGEDGDLCDGAVAALHSPRSLVDGGQVRVHVAGEASPARHLLPSCRHLPGKRASLRSDAEVSRLSIYYLFIDLCRSIYIVARSYCGHTYSPYCTYL